MKRINLTDMIKAADALDEARRDLKWSQTSSFAHDRLAFNEKHTRECETAYAESQTVLAEAIRVAEGRASARCVTAEDVVDAVRRLDEKICIAKTKLDGVTADIDINAQNFPNAYRYTPESTHVTVENRRGHWYVTDIRRAPCKRESRVYEVTHTDASREAIIDRLTTFR